MSLVIKMRGIIRDFPMGQEIVKVLTSIDLDIEKGDYVALMGPSGSGKSTLMNLLGCLDTTTAGTYELNGKNVSNMTDDELAEIRNKEIGFVFQTFNLLPRTTALDNVALPMVYAGTPKNARIKRAKEVLCEVGLEDRMDSRPSQLSGGQQQRVAVARALASKPDFVLADEPTANLDSASAFNLLDIMARLNKEEGITFVFSTHDQRVIERARRVITLEDGMIVSDEKRNEV